MGKFSCRWCFSCSCFPSSSTTPSLQPSTNAGTPRSPPSLQPTNAGHSTPTAIDLKNFKDKFNDISKLHDLIKFIEDLLKIASGESCEGFNSEVSSYILDGQTFLEFVDKHIGKLPQELDSMNDFSAETKKTLIKLLEGAGKIHWVGAALSVVGFVLARFNQMSDNKRDCLEVLKSMIHLGKQIVKLDEQMPEQKQTLNDAVECIVVGCCMCSSQLANSSIFRFLTASVNADSLKEFQHKIDRLYRDLELCGIIEIEERLPRNVPQSQEIYAYKQAVGIDSAQEKVIELLDLSTQNTSPLAVVVHGFGGIGKTTLADNVYKNIDLRSYKHCRILIIQYCTKNDLRALQEQILKDLFNQKVQLRDCSEGRGLIWSSLRKNPDQPVFLYIDNGLRREDLKELLPADLGSCLPPKSRILLTTRNLQETDIFVAWNVQRQAYEMSPLPSPEARTILLEKVSDYNDEENIHALLKLCGGVPLLLEIIGAQLAISIRNANNIEILDMISEGEKVELEDISDRMVDFVYNRLLPGAKEAFLDIAFFFSTGKFTSKYVACIVGDEEFRTLEEASFIKTDGRGRVIVHDIVQARGKNMSQGNRFTEPETLLECLEDEEKVKQLKGIWFDQPSEQPAVEINKSHLNCMSNSFRILNYKNSSQITFRGKCSKPFKQLRSLRLPTDIPDLPMEFEKLRHLLYYRGPLTQGMSLYKHPPRLRVLRITNIISSEDSETSSRDTPPSSLVELGFFNIPTMERLPEGVEKLKKLEELSIHNCPKLKELPFKIGELLNLEKIELDKCPGIQEWPSSIGDLSKLKTLTLKDCSVTLKESLPTSIIGNCKIEFS